MVFPIFGTAIKIVPAIGGSIAKFSAASGTIAAVGKASAAIGATKLGLAITAAVKTATAIVGIGKLAIVPVLIVALAYYNYDLFDPENRPYNVKEVDKEYDFIIVGGGSAGSVLASRLSEIPQWKVLLLEAGGHETEISDVPLLSLYLHKSKLDWKYRKCSECPDMQFKLNPEKMHWKFEYEKSFRLIFYPLGVPLF